MMDIDKQELFAAIDPFCRVAIIRKRMPDDFKNINEDRETPLRDILPGIWPTVEDLERLLRLGEKFGWKSSYQPHTWNPK